MRLAGGNLDDHLDAIAFDHVGIAVEDLDQALAFWRDQLGIEVGLIEEVEDQGARVAFLHTGEGTTELIESTRKDSPVGRFLASGRRGIHHIAYKVDDLDLRLERLRDAGVPLIHETPVEGSRGTRIAFIHPRGTNGVLVELVEYSEPRAND